MNPEHDQKLHDDFPQLYWVGDYHHEPWRSPYLGGFDCGDGWFDLLYELSQKLAPLVDKANAVEDMDDYKFQVIQVKEKFGGLRYYISSVPHEYADEIFDLIAEYEHKSYEICEDCGKPGEVRDLSWITTLCDEHYQQALDYYAKQRQEVIDAVRQVEEPDESTMLPKE